MRFADLLAVSTIIQEASDQGDEGMLAVAEVILKRTKALVMSNGTVVDTILRPYQFSGWNTTDRNRIRAAVHVDTEDRLYQKAAEAWQKAQAGSNTTNGATHYYNPLVVVMPSWAKGLVPCASIGEHLFFNNVR